MTYYKIIYNILLNINGYDISIEDVLSGLLISCDLPLCITCDSNIIKTHQWNIDKVLFLRGNTNSLYCVNCKINFVRMFNPTKTLTCEEQIIKNIIE